MRVRSLLVSANIPPSDTPSQQFNAALLKVLMYQLMKTNATIAALKETLFAHLAKTGSTPRTEKGLRKLFEADVEWRVREAEQSLANFSAQLSDPEALRAILECPQVRAPAG